MECNKSHLIKDRAAQYQKNGGNHLLSHMVSSQFATKGSNIVIISKWVTLKCLNTEQKRSWATTLYIMTLCTAKKLKNLTLLNMDRREIKA